ncbi:MAG: hypothetical protein ACJ72M_07245 [Propionibacteriaceae bacterium]
MAEDASWWTRLFSWCGVALIAAAVLMVVATLLHPSRETAATIVAGEPRLVAAHVVYTVAWLLVLLGIPGLYAAQRGQMGRLGLAGFLTSFTGTYLIAVTGNFGFLAPVLAKQSPAVLDSINQYLPVVIINGLAAILFMIGYVLFGIAMIRTATLPRWSGVLVAVGAPAHLLGFRDCSADLHRRVADRDLGQCKSRRRTGVARLPGMAETAASNLLDTSMSTG